MNGRETNGEECSKGGLAVTPRERKTMHHRLAGSTATGHKPVSGTWGEESWWWLKGAACARVEGAIWIRHTNAVARTMQTNSTARTVRVFCCAIDNPVPFFTRCSSSIIQQHSSSYIGAKAMPPQAPCMPGGVTPAILLLCRRWLCDLVCAPDVLTHLLC
jgi:hypothetical protein